MEGQVGFDDAPGGGTIFHVDLPAAGRLMRWQPSSPERRLRSPTITRRPWRANARPAHPDPVRAVKELAALPGYISNHVPRSEPCFSTDFGDCAGVALRRLGSTICRDRMSIGAQSRPVLTPCRKPMVRSRIDLCGAKALGGRKAGAAWLARCPAPRARSAEGE